MELKEHEYYQVGQRLLYWDGEKWMKPVKDSRGNIGGYLTDCEQPKKIKDIMHVPDVNRWVKHSF